MITDQVHYCVNAHCTYFTVHIFSSKQPKQPCVCPAFYAKSVQQEFPWKKKKRNGSRWCWCWCSKRVHATRELGRGSKNSSQPSEEIAVGRELLSRNVLTFSNFSCFLFPPLHRIDNFIIIIATLERRQIKQRDPEQLAGDPSLFHPFFLQRIKIFLLPSD